MSDQDGWQRGTISGSKTSTGTKKCLGGYEGMHRKSGVFHDLMLQRYHTLTGRGH